MSIHAYTPGPLPPLFEHLVEFFGGLGATLHCSKIGQYRHRFEETADWENRYILIRIYLPAVKHLNIQKIFFINRIDLPKYCCSIAQVVVTSFTKLVYMFFFEDSALQDQPCAPLKL